MLLQEIRAKQAIQEEGLELSVDLIHAEEPVTIVGDRTFKLLFPRAIFSYTKEKTPEEILFIGKMTPSREKFFEGVPATVVESLRGRDVTTKTMDHWYFDRMGRAEFVLCPDGDFTWTYRFFEAVMVKAIPIIENECVLYEGYKYYRKGDIYVYRQNWIDHNLERIKDMLW
jgi:hypothetical protein